ncbi:MAG TPA: outer membrane beta-barrel protein [Elusimicrobiales bacterium]|nr:outer membrane beta-barrel protein [Elusimicrobiales bacterium]
MTRTIIALLLTLQAGSAFALQNIKLAGVDINPVFSSQEKYDSNIYLTRDLVKASLYNRSMGGLNLAKEGSRLKVDVGYNVEGLFYSRAHRINDAVHHNANASVEMKLAEGRTLKASDRYAATTDQATSELTARAKRVQNNAELVYDSPLKGRLGFSVDAQHIVNDYLVKAYKNLDRDEIIGGASLNYKVQPKTTLFLAYHFGSLKYWERALSGTGSALHSNVDAGISGNIAPKLTGKLMAGAQFRTYRKELAGASRKKTTGGYGAQLAWKPVSKTEVVLYGKRGNVESTFSNSRFYTSTLNDLSVSREINKFKATLGASYESIRYPEEVPGDNAKRRDSYWNGRAGLDYNIQKWLKAGVGYAYKTRVSNYRSNNYVDNITTLEVKGMF